MQAWLAVKLPNLRNLAAWALTGRWAQAIVEHNIRISSNRSICRPAADGRPRMISQTAEYALRATVFLADREGAACTTAQIAEGTLIPQGYLAKVMQALSRARVVRAQRGPNGGFTLRQFADELTLLEVINAVDPIRRIHECPLNLPHHGPNLCPLHRKLDECAAWVERELGNTTVADVLKVPPRRKPLCRFPFNPVEVLA